MTHKSFEAEMELLPYQKYSEAVSVCNNLAMLASKCTTVIFVQRITVLKSIESCWTKGFEANMVTPEGHDAAAENGLSGLLTKVSDGGIGIKLEPGYSHASLENLAVDGGDSSDGTIVDDHLIEEEDRGKLNAAIGEEKELGAERSKGAAARGRSRVKRKKKTAAMRKGKTKHTKKEPKDVEEPAEEECDNGVLMTKDSKSSYKFLCFACKDVFKTFSELNEHRTLVHAAAVATVQFGVTKRGRRTLLHLGHEYWRCRQNAKGHTWWRCCKHQTHTCRAHLTTDGAGAIVAGERSPEHTHCDDIAAALARKAISDMKGRMTTETAATPSSSIDAVVADLAPRVLMALPKRASLHRILRRHRQVILSNDRSRLRHFSTPAN